MPKTLKLPNYTEKRTAMLNDLVWFMEKRVKVVHKMVKK